MTISVPGKAAFAPPVTAYHHTLDGETGFLLQIGAAYAFVSDADADRLGRYLLFDKEPALGETAKILGIGDDEHGEDG